MSSTPHRSKALSNQKFNDFCALFGPDRVGLATGDNSIRPNADLVVMTTEVLRNMLYSAAAQRSTERLMWVVLDEVHYLADPYRGTAWEEVVINTPADVGFVCLSATISNAETFGRWLRERRGPTEVVISTKRPVELHNLHMIYDNHENKLVEFAPTDVAGKANPKWKWIEKNRHRPDRHNAWDDDDDWDEPRSWRFSTPTHSAVVNRLQQRRILPALFFVFSRAGCDRAAAELSTRRTLVNNDEADQIAQIAARRLSHLTPTEHADLNTDAWIARTRSGVAAHHAGLLPAFKETVEECFIAGLIKVVFATETLALGMHMPARTVVINTLTKFNGASHELLRPIEFTQISGRAGRRGIDTDGHCVTLWSPYIAAASPVSLHKGEPPPLTSMFAPNYNMVANLAARHTRETAATFLDRSFAQFLVDELERLEIQRENDRTLARNPYGDAAETRNLLNTPTKHLETEAANLKRGSVIADPDNPNERLVVIGAKHTSAKTIEQRNTRRGKPHNRAEARTSLRVVNSRGELRSIPSLPLGTTLPALGNVPLPEQMSYKRPAFKKAAADALNAATDLKDPPPPQTEPTPAEPHPAADDPQHNERLAAQERLPALNSQIAQLRHSLNKASKGQRLAATFNAVSDMLTKLGYIDTDWNLTDAGRILAAIHREQDILIAETIRRGHLDNLDDASLAGVVSTLVYEHRDRSPPPPAAYPTDTCRQAVTAIANIRTRLRSQERSRHIDLTPPDEHSTGFFNHAYAWAAGTSLREAAGRRITPGDFIRTVKGIADLLHQISHAAPTPALRTQAGRAARAIVRGVVASDAVSQLATTAAPPADNPAAAVPSPALDAVLEAIAGKPAHQHRTNPATTAPRTGTPTQPHKQDHCSVAGLKHRGWTDAMIRDLLGEPDKRGANPHYRKAAPTRLFKISRVELIEATEAFTERMALADRRRANAHARRRSPLGVTDG